MLKAIIVDDELSAIESLQWEINNFCSDVSIEDSFTNPKKAINAINYLKPDIVFLDIEMPELDGFQLLKNLNYRGFDLIITTAYNQYAIKAFKENAIDYLLKPVDPDELVKAIEKVKQNQQNNTLGIDVERMLERFVSDNNKLKRIPFTLHDKVVMVNVDDILYFKSDGNYTHVFMEDGSSYLLSKSIKKVFDTMSQDGFIRVHKSFVINVKFVSEYLRGDGGEVIMKDKMNIPVSRSHKQKLLKVLNIS